LFKLCNKYINKFTYAASGSSSLYTKKQYMAGGSGSAPFTNQRQEVKVLLFLAFKRIHLS